MLKSILSEILGTPPANAEGLASLSRFRGKCHVLVLFEGSADDRPEMQEALLTNQHESLAARDVVLLRVVGGGVFSSLENPMAIDADDIRFDLEGPSIEEFELVLVHRDGAIILRSNNPVDMALVYAQLDKAPDALH
ncbi:DUF4174 domain-containing protein [Rhizobium sp. S152]|uniref:DUF4174 domain-containing protein n=1 Tax=Rhizobium sp. S152 TaxID=3055038 RepID=UPI0025A96D5D|nr:DUF4174 domain-containing protein [Rhizobium sp. S152]MDM9627891.1 DUF4174 domain-containing protein [Rhizobium sp. S152]